MASERLAVAVGVDHRELVAECGDLLADPRDLEAGARGSGGEPGGQASISAAPSYARSSMPDVTAISRLRAPSCHGVRSSRALAVGPVQSNAWSGLYVNARPPTASRRRLSSPPRAPSKR